MSERKMTPDRVRSARWFGPDDLRSFGHRSRAKQMGYAPEEYLGRPVIGIINTWNDLNSCHTHFPSGSRTSAAASTWPAASPSSCRRCRWARR